MSSYGHVTKIKAHCPVAIFLVRFIIKLNFWSSWSGQSHTESKEQKGNWIKKGLEIKVEVEVAWKNLWSSSPGFWNKQTDKQTDIVTDREVIILKRNSLNHNAGNSTFCF